MLTTNSILARDQGKMFAKPKNEDDYYAHYVPAAEKAKPAIQQKTHTESCLGFAWGWLFAHVGRSELQD